MSYIIVLFSLLMRSTIIFCRYLSELYIIYRLNSEDCWVFYTDGWIFIFKSWICRALKINRKYGAFGSISWEFRPENAFFSFRVGVSVGGQDLMNSNDSLPIRHNFRIKYPTHICATFIKISRIGFSIWSKFVYHEIQYHLLNGITYLGYEPISRWKK